MWWLIFHLLLIVLLWIDLKERSRSWKQSLLWSGIWILAAFAWNGVVYAVKGPTAALAFFTAYLLEKALSVDNLCLFLLIFSSFQVPQKYERKILLWGILGAIVFRMVLILAGIRLIEAYHPIFYLFGIVVLSSGIRFLFRKPRHASIQEHWFFKWLQRHLPIASHFAEGKFWIEENGKRVFSLLAVVLILIEASDVMFAFDSIPAVLAITQDPFIAYTSNICAILGLRSLYFVLTPWLQQVEKGKWGLGILLLFIGSKMVLEPFWTIPTSVSLLIIVLILTFTSLVARKKV